MMFFTIAFFCTERYVFSTIKSISQVKLKINSFLDKSSTKFRHFRAYCTTNRHIILLFKILQQYSPLFDKYLSTFFTPPRRSRNRVSARILPWASVRTVSVAFWLADAVTFVSLRALQSADLFRGLSGRPRAFACERFAPFGYTSTNSADLIQQNHAK